LPKLLSCVFLAESIIILLRPHAGFQKKLSKKLPNLQALYPFKAILHVPVKSSLRNNNNANTPIGKLYL
jgi:hypothetical protein